MADIDLTTPGSTTTIDGVIVTYGDPIGSGTGIYSPFLGIDDNDGDEMGFNTDATGVLDTDQSKTSSLTFNDIPVKIINGVEYFEFRLDLNQTNANTLISLTSLKLYYSSDPATSADYVSATHELDSDFTKVFDLDGNGDTRLLLDAHSSGSGNDDYVFYVPVSSFAGADFSTDYITMYADFGTPGTIYAANDGFEEFNTEKVSTINGVKFGDTDGDGVKDAGEVGLAGWTIFIDSNENGVLDLGERSTVTDANGAFQFAGVGTSLESVRIDEVLQAGWVQTTGDYETVDVSSAGNYSVQIGNFLPNPALNITKDASVPGGTADWAGEVVSYTISVANTGNVALTGVTVTDPFVSNLAPVLSSGFNSGDVDHDNVLDLTETWHYTATHTVTQAEIDAGGTIDNTATADSDQTGADTDDASIPVAQNPALNITKDASVPGGTADWAGEMISYTITVANTGNMTLNGVTVTDPFADVGSIVRGADVVGDNDALLEVGETWGYTAAHTVTQAEIDSNGGGDGLLQNVATADSNETGPDTDDASVPIDQRPSLNITKDASVPGGTADAAGELISYTITVANTGNTTLTGVTVTDPFADVGSIVRGADVSGDNDALLEVGETWGYTAAHTVTQAEIDSNGSGDGLLQNVATADSNETGEDTDDASVPVEQRASLNITKDASVPGGTADAAGELISYTISLANTGNTSLTDVTVTDPFADLGSIVRGADTVGNNDGVLDVGETWSYTAAHTVTQAELDSNGGGDGLLQNTATADSNETGPDTDDANVPVEQRAGIDIEKYVSIDGGLTWDDADSPQGPVATSGADIQFKFVVSNTGNVSLTNATVTDSVFDLNGAAAGTAMSLGTLDVGETDTFYYDASWVAGQHVNDATATGTYSGGPVTDHDLAYYFGLIDCVGVRTPGFWLSPNGLTFWDGTVGNETKSGPEFPTGELLAFNNSINDGPDAGSSNKEERYILLGDDNGNGVTDAGEDTLQMSLALALKVIDASQKTQQDARYVLGRDAIAAWLNFEAGNPSGDPTDLNSPAHKMDLAIDWLQQYADANHDGIADFNGAAVKQSSAAWQGSGAALHTALDEYNNFGTVNGVAYSCDADDHVFVDALVRYHEDVLA
ncbi:DUF7507 domain-containing protein [Caulobacter sp. LjRoot300]|uniref:DUF7507 domain-containing protein n=1 Tax=Caulobacter sp. LjRoot300 TaxID=3342321 RepID=UPI003ECE72AA